ncbi:mammalian cell entry protein [Mycolicibacterium sp. F2034L]|uniref:mammalian cell entry protein n=1 Tax=Mycolicibacterium sp. F2034L TaxID=2926422 RepID=UPI001FF4F595|nr:mammalian cell entry protein [Mycolicibacterium sp. F2034L]MCK0176756.1 mammalian cell entry protein [Mycolicibacterium sp. F2034L]
MTEESASSSKPVRRRAYRPTGPAKGSAGQPATGVVPTDAPGAGAVRVPRPAAPPPRRQPHRALVAAVCLGFLALTLAAVTTLVGVWSVQQREAEAEQAREQRFVDTAKQTVVNMFSYTQNTIDESVNRFVDGTSGPLRDMLSQGNNVDNLKALFIETEASAEAVVNGAALEKLDEVSDNASVLVAVRVTITDLDGNNQPSEPYRLRVIVHEDDSGRMTGYDLKYPDGGN